MKEVGDRLASVLKEDYGAPHVFVSIGENEIGRVKSKELRRRCREALGWIRDPGGVSLTGDILPRKSVSSEWLFRGIAING